MDKLYEFYIRFMVWLGAAPPTGYEYLLKPEKIAPLAPPSTKTVEPKPETQLTKAPPTPEQIPIVKEPEPAIQEVKTPFVEPEPLVQEIEPPPVEPELVPEPEPLIEPEPPIQETEPPPIAPEPIRESEPQPIMPEVVVTEPKPIPFVAPSLEFDPLFPPVGSMDVVRALYISYEALGNSEQLEKIFQLLDNAEFTGVVIDAKGDNSLVSYPTQVPIAQEIGAAQPSIENFTPVMDELKRRAIYTIARLVMFKDDLFAKNYPEYGVKIKGTNQLWQDGDGLQWGDPFQAPVWGYNLQLAAEAAQLGFDEMLFDYLRFPTLSHMGEPEFSQELTRDSRVAAITSFLSMARGHLQPYHVKVAVNLFGYACWRKDDSLIGQDIERIGPHVDIICPILYPSAFNRGVPGYKNAVAHPYEVVHRSAERAIKRINGLDCTIRPWIQDFPDYSFDQRVFDKEGIQQQIKGCFDAGSEGFMVWNPHTVYTTSAYAPVKRSFD